MHDQPCPTCHNPLGVSLQALRQERDQLIPFLLENSHKKQAFLAKEKELQERLAQLDQDEKNFIARVAELEENFAALEELKNDTDSGQKELLQLRQQNQSLIGEVNALKGRIHALENIAVSPTVPSELENENLDLKRQIVSFKSNLKGKQRDLEELKGKFETLKARKSELQRKKNALSRECEALTSENETLAGKVSSLTNERNRIQSKLDKCTKEAEDLRSACFSITDIDLLDALSRAPAKEFCCPRNFVTLGSGPFAEGDFDAYLVEHGIEVHPSGYPCIIVGRDGWSEERLNELLDEADPEEVRVFSQELFMAGYLTTHDPFSLPVEILLKFATGHPALEYLIDQGFEWPQIVLEQDYGEPVYVRSSLERVEESPLYRMGYQVGNTRGLRLTRRRRLLEDAYFGEIPEVEDDDYMEEWGLPGHSKRLWRIAHHIACLIRTRRRQPAMHQAIQHWQEDLDWMEEQFYTSRMRFKWPGN